MKVTNKDGIFLLIAAILIVPFLVYTIYTQNVELLVYLMGLGLALIPAVLALMGFRPW